MRLAEVLIRRLAGVERLVACERLTAGASRETYCVDIMESGRVRRLALRRGEAGGGSMLGAGPGLAVEAELMKAARRAGVDGPEVLAVLQPEDDLAEGFIMSWVEGETLGGRIARGPAFASVRPGLARQCGEILARIHGIEVEGVAGSGRLARLPPEQAIETTYNAYLDMQSAQPMIDFTAAWLRRNLPTERPLRLTHGDFRNGNFIVDPEKGVVAVLDWELAHLGDPVRDLGWLCTRSWRFGAPDKPVGGFGEIDELIAGYEAAGGAPVDRAALRFWEVFGSFWWAVGCLGMARSFRAGDERSVERPAIGRRSSECQIDCVNLLIPGPARTPEPRVAAWGSDLPRTDELLAGVHGFLSEAASRLPSRHAFLARVAGNTIDIVMRELSLGPDAARHAQSSIGGLLGETGAAPELRRALAAAIRDGRLDLDDPQLHAVLRDDVLAQAMIDQPTYPGVREAAARKGDADAK
ncbi:phosphotransferase [bacterium]|nr:phosphotransferase [bacterium]